MNKHIMKLFLIFYMLTFILVLPIWGEKAAVVLSSSSDLYNDALNGLKKTARFKVDIYDMERDLVKGRQIMRKLTTQDVNLVVVIGTEAAIAAKTLNADIPIVYTMVLAPINYPKHRATGVIIKIGINKQLAMIAKMFPGKKRIGVIYNPKYSRQDIEQARKLVSKYKFKLFPIAVENQTEIPNALLKFTNESVDLLWMVIDKTVLTPLGVKCLIRHSLKENIPLIGLSKYHVKAGALAAFSGDFFDIGSQTAKIVQTSLKSGTKSRIETPRKIIFWVNPKIQKQLGIDDLSVFPEVQFIQ